MLRGRPVRRLGLVHSHPVRLDAGSVITRHDDDGHLVNPPAGVHGVPVDVGLVVRPVPRPPAVKLGPHLLHRPARALGVNVITNYTSMSI